MLAGMLFGMMIGGSVTFVVMSLFLTGERSELMRKHRHVYLNISKCIDHYCELQTTVPDPEGCSYLDGKVDGLNEALKCFEEDES